MTVTYQWRRCDSSGGSCVDIDGATSSDYTLTSDDVGHRLRVVADDGTTTVTSDPTLVITTAPSPSSDYDTATAYAASRPSFTPTRTVSVANQSQLLAAISDLRAGDLVRPSASFSVAGETTIAKRLASPGAVLELDYSGHTVSFNYGGNTNTPSVWIHDSSHVTIYGGDVTNPAGGPGVLLYGATDHVTWWDFVIHDTGSSGLAMLKVGGDIDSCDFKGEIYHPGKVLSWDPHSEKGSGLHGAILADVGNGYAFKNNRLALYCHDIPVGAAIELGSEGSGQILNNTMYLKAINLTFVAHSQTGGNGFNFWGGAQFVGNTVPYVEVSNAQGRAVDNNGVYSSSVLSGLTVEYGRHSGTGQNSNLTSLEGVSASVAWDTRGGIHYVDID